MFVLLSPSPRMQLLKEIRETKKDTSHISRDQIETVRAVLLDRRKTVPLIFVTAESYHRLPGGLINPKEDQKAAVRRLVQQQIGCQIAFRGELGKIIERRATAQQKVVSYCYYAKVTRQDEAELTDEQQAARWTTRRLSMKDAIARLAKDTPTTPEG